MQLELEPLGFIAKQVGVVLQALDSRIRREQTISIVKHDLYSPLTMIRNTLNRMREDEESGKPRGEYHFDNLDSSSYFALNLVSQLDVTPGQFGAFAPTPIFIEGDILARVVSMLRPYAWDTNRIQIKFDNIRVIPKLSVDRAMIERAIHNLIVNAIKYGDPKSTIAIEGRKTRAGYCLDVKNDGIEPDEEKLIGQLHYRSSKAKLAAMGLGFGLYIAKGVMHRHGGNFTSPRPRTRWKRPITKSSSTGGQNSGSLTCGPTPAASEWSYSTTRCRRPKAFPTTRPWMAKPPGVGCFAKPVNCSKLADCR